MKSPITFGLPKMHMEAGERRAWLPPFVAELEKHGARVVLEHGYGSGMGYTEASYQALAPNVRFADNYETYQQDYVLILRCPQDEYLRQMRPGSTLMSMLHYPTRPQRRAFLKSLGVEGISLDSIMDDGKRRLVENLRSVAWNGLEVAFQTLRPIYPSPGLESPDRPPLYVTLLGSGAVGLHVVQAAIRYADTTLWKDLASRGVPGVQVMVVDFDTTKHKDTMMEILTRTDILVDATQRPNPSAPVIPNDWIRVMPEHAVLLDLSVDPYNCDTNPVIVKGIEGIPQGNLDQYIFRPDDPVYAKMPNCVRRNHRRFAVSCYSWPGIHPKRCMRLYGRQLRPIMNTLLEKGCVENIDPNGRFFERAISRAVLSRWEENNSQGH